MKDYESLRKVNSMDVRTPETLIESFFCVSKLAPHQHLAAVSDWYRLDILWLVVWNMAFICPFHIWNVILPMNFHIIQDC